MKYILTYIIQYILEENIIIKLNYKNKINIYLLLPYQAHLNNSFNSIKNKLI